MTRLLGILGLALLASAGPAWAVPTLSFDNPTVDGGTFSYAGAGGPATGSNIIFQQVIGVDTPVNAGVSLFCFPANCTMTFTTGANTLEGPPVYTWGGGGSIAMTGGLNTAADGSGAQIVPGGTALVVAGVFDDPSLTLAGFNTATFLGIGTDTKNATLAGFYGLGVDFGFVNSLLSLGETVINPITGAFAGTVTDADFQNTAVVPNPAALLLLGIGLVGLSARARRG